MPYYFDFNGNVYSFLARCHCCFLSKTSLHCPVTVCCLFFPARPLYIYLSLSVTCFTSDLSTSLSLSVTYFPARPLHLPVTICYLFPSKTFLHFPVTVCYLFHSRPLYIAMSLSVTCFPSKIYLHLPVTICYPFHSRPLHLCHCLLPVSQQDFYIFVTVCYLFNSKIYLLALSLSVT